MTHRIHDQVLAMTRAGVSAADIASSLSVSTRTVHRVRVRLGIAQTAALVAEVERLRRAVDLHTMTVTETPDDRWECCASCGADWPCPTAQVAYPRYPNASAAGGDAA